LVWVTFLEKQSGELLQLSTAIENAVRPNATTKKAAGWPWGIWAFYLLVLGVLVAATAAGWYLADRSPSVTQALVHYSVRPTP
jgi:hypothetical protein